MANNIKIGIATFICRKCNSKFTKKVYADPFSSGVISTKDYQFVSYSTVNEILNCKVIHICDKNSKTYGVAYVSEIDFNDTDIDLNNTKHDENDCMSILRINNTKEGDI